MYVVDDEGRKGGRKGEGGEEGEDGRVYVMEKGECMHLRESVCTLSDIWLCLLSRIGIFNLLFAMLAADVLACVYSR